jgi:hypothetical protein
MSKFLLTTLALSLAIVSAPGVAWAATAKPDKCAPRPGDFRRQCLIELGGYCDPATGRVTLEGPGASAITGIPRWESCIERKRAQQRR